jgi:hypothetical protein
MVIRSYYIRRPDRVCGRLENWTGAHVSWIAAGRLTGYSRLMLVSQHRYNGSIRRFFLLMRTNRAMFRMQPRPKKQRQPKSAKRKIRKIAP